MEAREEPCRPVATASPWPHRLAWALATTVFPLIWMGGTVTTYDAGMAVPDWPTTYSYWFYPVQLWLAVWDVFLEHGHRLLAQLAGALAILLAVPLWRRDDRRWMRWVAATVVLGVIAQGVLGGLRVWADDRVLARIHGCTAALYFALCAAVVTWTSRAWRESEESPSPDPSHLARREYTVGSISLDQQPPRVCSPGARYTPWANLAWFVVVAIYLEIVVGAQLRRPAANAGFLGDEPSSFVRTLTAGQLAGWFELWVWVKVLGAGVIACTATWLVVAVLRSTRGQPAEPPRIVGRRARWLAGILIAQLSLAVATWVLNYGWPAWFTARLWPLQSSIVAQGRWLVVATTAHAAAGSLALAAALSLALWLSRMKPRPVVAIRRRDRRSRLCAYISLIRPPIVALVLLAMAVAAWTTGVTPPPWSTLANALLGAAMVIAGAISLNARIESRGDAKMPRTADRPLPAGRLAHGQVTRFGLAATAAGLVYLAIATNPTLTGLAALGWLVYVAVYTPLKTRTQWQSPIGAAAGAMPVLMGAAVANAALGPGALILYAVVFFWQWPHSMAIAWRYRREFAEAGVKVAPAVDPTGRTAGVWALAGAAALLPTSLAPWCFALAGWRYGATALALGIPFLVLAGRFAHCRNDATAWQLRLGSLIYLPAMLALAAIFWMGGG